MPENNYPGLRQVSDEFLYTKPVCCATHTQQYFGSKCLLTWGMRGHLLEEKASTPAPGATVVPLSLLTRGVLWGENSPAASRIKIHCKFSNYIFQLLCEC